MNEAAKKRLSKKAGLPPGSLVYTGSRAQPTTFTLVSYDKDNFKMLENISVQAVIEGIGANMSNWLIITGFGDTESLEKVGSHFEISSLILEDIFNVEHLPKVEDLGTSIFITLKSLKLNGKKVIETGQISIFLGKNVLITFQEEQSNLFDPVIERLKNAKGTGRLKQEDFLAYLLIDHIVDQYYLLLDNCEDQVEVLEKNLFTDPKFENAARFLHFKKMLSVLRRSIYPFKEEIRYLTREESPVISSATRQYLNDVHDHLNHIIQTIDNYREMVSSMLDLQAANASNRMNGIMKTLTLVSTIFIPLTFAVGIYGMNFRYMPELEWKYGYPAFMVLMAILSYGMYLFMKRRRWF
ncbi:MAG: magnesium/cobalt transporter CorA [Bacteroidales bacterium]|nr:magnesium/cobalt transporter CorA [Bacteroidales bacterium]